MLHYAKRLIESRIRERRKARSPQWRKVRDAHLRANPTCAACGKRKYLQVHHVEPYHLDPAKELDPANLISLCMGDNECHLYIGHGDDFKAYNPEVRKHAKEALALPQDRKKIASEAIVGRRYEDVPAKKRIR